VVDVEDKIMLVYANGSGAVKDDRWTLTRGTGKVGDWLWWLTPKDIDGCKDMIEWIVLPMWLRTSGISILYLKHQFQRSSCVIFL
jgi:hypothetical protein